MALREQQQHSPSFLDALLCEEQNNFEDDFDANVTDSETNTNDPSTKKFQSLPSILLDNDLFWEHDELVSLISKEKETHLFSSLDDNNNLIVVDGSLEDSRVEAVNWVSRVCSHYGFSALTTVLAVNYFDRFITSLKFQKDKPWMTQLTAVACLSLAAKMEETHVPLLLDLQVEDSRFVFEAKTIQRMELLVLSTLKWRMHPVTPISFFEHIVRRLGLKSRLHWEFMWRCERVLLHVIVDSKAMMSYLPSTLAAATMIHVIKEIEPFNATEYIDQLMGLLKISEEQVNQCYKLMLKLLVCHDGIYSLHQKRKHLSEPSSPGGVMDASFSCDSSNDSWTVASSSVSPSLQPVFKRSRAQDQQMRLPSVNRVSIDVLNSPR
ncbi:cyclin-D3-3 [Cicer arietinum]|uniref:B-like cyclin n=1 Tax=Cicer arietinum TaxID=3827 RepID=A0A1S2YS96_CICAR|nr:cyclin-D3-3 [Cicer arietinum]